MTAPHPIQTEADLREAMARALYLLDPFPSAEDPGEPMRWEDVPGWARDRNLRRADILIAGPLAAYLSSADTLRRERDDWQRRYGLSTDRALDAMADRDAAETALAATEANLLDLAKMYGEACGELQVRSYLLQGVVDEAQEEVEQVRDESADQMRMLDAIAKKLGLAHDEGLDDAAPFLVAIDTLAEASSAADRETVERVEAENVRLKAALKPFADYAEHMPGRDFGHGEIGEYYHGGFRVSIRTQDLEAASAALSPKGQPDAP